MSSLLVIYLLALVRVRCARATVLIYTARAVAAQSVRFYFILLLVPLLVVYFYSSE